MDTTASLAAETETETAIPDHKDVSKPIDQKAASKEATKALRELIAPVRGALWFGNAMAVLSAALGVFPFVALVGIGNEMVAGLQPGDDIDAGRVNFWVMVLLGTFMARLLVYMLGLVVTHVADKLLSASLQNRIVSQLSAAPLSWFGENTSGHVRKAMQDDIRNLHMLVAHRPVDSLVAVLLPVFCSVYAFVIDWRLGLLVILSIPTYGVAYGIMMRGMENKTQELDAKLDRVSAAMIEFVKGIQVVKTFGIVGQAHRKYAESADEACTFMEKWNMPMVKAASLSAAIISTPTIVLVVGFGGAWMVGLGWVTAVEVIAACLIAIALPGSIILVANMMWAYQLAGSAAKRIIDVMNVSALPTPVKSLRQPADASVEIVDASVHYGEVAALNGVSLTCRPGTITALMGASGAGKTTLAKLMARFLDSDSGAVKIGGVEVRDLSRTDLYRSVSFVLQDAHLLRATVAENIAMGRPGASREDIERVAREAQIHEEILQFPRGYDTVVGQDVRLSGGQEQRIAIARALLMDTPILILDEAAAMVDPESEAQIQAAITKLTKGRTVIVIDHRPASIRHVDQIVLLEHGRVVACGRHEELVENPLYRRLWEASGGSWDEPDSGEPPIPVTSTSEEAPHEN